MSEEFVQATMFDDSADFVPTPRTANQWAFRAAKLQEEIRVGQWDYDRLIVDMKQYEQVVKDNKGIEKWTNRAAEYRAIEARTIVRFLKHWKSRKDNLEVQLEECMEAIRKMV